MRSYCILALVLSTSTVMGWPLAKKFSDCTNDRIRYVLSRACALAKRSTVHGTRLVEPNLIEHHVADSDELETAAWEIIFTTALLHQTEAEPGDVASPDAEPRDVASPDVDGRKGPHVHGTKINSVKALRHVRQEHAVDHNHIIRACCSEERCSPNSLVGLAELCED